MANVKGANVLSAVKMLRAHRERAVALLPPRYHRYLDERILVSSWYPEADQLELLRAVSFLLPGTPDPWIVMGRTAARQDLANLYRYMVRPGDLKETMRSASSLWSTFHDSGQLRVTLEGPQSAIADLRDYAAATREMCRVTSGYVTEVAATGGAREIKTVKLACAIDGAPQCTWRMSWAA
jgi:hypothetical protein